MNIREKIIEKTPLVYASFMEVEPIQLIYKKVACSAYQTKDYEGKKFYKFISIYSI